MVKPGDIFDHEIPAPILSRIFAWFAGKTAPNRTIRVEVVSVVGDVIWVIREGFLR